VAAGAPFPELAVSTVVSWDMPGFYAHAVAALAEGFCPAGHGPVERVRAADGGAAGRCPAPDCGWWHHIVADEEVQWSIPYDPVTGLPRIPDWLAA